MRIHYIMRYYHPFPEAIPRLEVGCSRVTHPSATKIKKQAYQSPFDLHVLGVPPAFVLSQDQTLHKFVSLQDFSCHNQLFTNHSQLLHSVLVFFLTSLLFSFSFKNRNLRVPVYFSIVHFSRCKFLFVVRFEAFFVLHRCNYFIIPHFRKFVKPFFKVF